MSNYQISKKVLYKANFSVFYSGDLGYMVKLQL